MGDVWQVPAGLVSVLFVVVNLSGVGLGAVPPNSGEDVDKVGTAVVHATLALVAVRYLTKTGSFSVKPILH